MGVGRYVATGREQYGQAPAQHGNGGTLDTVHQGLALPAAECGKDAVLVQHFDVGKSDVAQ